MKQSKQLTQNQQEALVDTWERDPFNNSRSGSERGVRLKTLRHLVSSGYLREDVEFANGVAVNVNYKLTLAGRERLYALIDDDDAIEKLQWMANQIRTNLQLRLVFFGCACWLDFAAARIRDMAMTQEVKSKKLAHADTVQQPKGERKHVA